MFTATLEFTAKGDEFTAKGYEFTAKGDELTAIPSVYGRKHSKMIHLGIDSCL